MTAAEERSAHPAEEEEERTQQTAEEERRTGVSAFRVPIASLSLPVRFFFLAGLPSPDTGTKPGLLSITIIISLQGNRSGNQSELDGNRRNRTRWESKESY